MEDWFGKEGREAEGAGTNRAEEEGRKEGSELSPMMTEGKRRRERTGEESISRQRSINVIIAVRHFFFPSGETLSNFFRRFHTESNNRKNDIINFFWQLNAIKSSGSPEIFSHLL